jgi:hypothetical protein
VAGVADLASSRARAVGSSLRIVGPCGCWWPRTRWCWPNRIVEGLRDAGLAADVGNDGQAALTKAGLAASVVVVLDLDLPVVRGDQVCRTLAGGVRPDPAADRGRRCRRPVDGLELGADDDGPDEQAS